MIRIAKERDAGELLRIYSWYVEHTAITFEYEVPSLEEFTGRIRNTLAKYPYFVAERDGRIVGYAYASAFKGRKAYDWSVETSIYVEHGSLRAGVGKELYAMLENALAMQNIINVNACIGVPVGEDPYLDRNSVEFHEHYGYRMVGEFRLCGYKFDRWYHMVWMEKFLTDHPNKPDPVIPFPEIRASLAEKYDIR